MRKPMFCICKNKDTDQLRGNREADQRLCFCYIDSTIPLLSNQDVMGEKPVKNDAGQLLLDEESKKEAWKEHYERLLNVEFPWNPEDLSEESPVEGPSEPITLEMITKAITKMASGKAAGPSGIVA